MPDLCKNDETRRFIAHSLRTTAITAMSDAGLTTETSMFMSDTKCEESLKSYCRHPSKYSTEKVNSTILGSVATDERNQTIVNSIVPTNASMFLAVTNQKLSINKESSNLTTFGANSIFKDCTFILTI